MVAKFKAIIPRPVNIEAITAELVAGMDKEGSEPIQDLNATTATWQGAKPTWKKVLTPGQNSIVLRIDATGSEKGIQKWSMLDQGTPPHLIAARNGGRLAFQTGFTAKTTPGSFSSGSGGSSGPFVFPQVVHHPGTAPRKWTELLVQKYEPKFWEAIRVAMARAAIASGHGK